MTTPRTVLDVRPHSRPVALAAALAASLAAAPRAGAGVALAARLNHDTGTVFVSGKETGLGGGVGLRVAFARSDRGQVELGADLDVAGFSGEGDGDPIFIGTAHLSWKGFLGAPRPGSARAFWSVGGGAGALGIAGAGAAFPLRVSLGVSLPWGTGAGLELAVFERLTLTNTGGDPAWQHVHSAGLELAVRLGR
jgi:hypothetical protein